jgi:hypothetical protein
MSDEAGGGLLLRLPHDAALTAGVRVKPDLSAFQSTVDDYARAHDDAVSRADHRGRARSCWGLIARGVDSLAWVRRELVSRDEMRVEDAAGVLEWIGVPTDMVSTLRGILDSLPDGQAADAVAAALGGVVAPEPSERAHAIAEEPFAGSFAPFTDAIWFVDAPFAAVVAAATTWLAGLGGRSFTSIDEPLPAIFDALEPWAHLSWKQVLVPTRSNWTAIFSQGADIGTHEVLARELGCRSLRTHASPHIVRNGHTVSFGDCAFWLRNDDDSRRSIQASFQSRWQWHLSGDPQPFEDPASHEAKRIPDRFDLSRLNAYCRALGIRRNDPEFYLPHGFIIEQDTSAWPQRPQSRSSSEWRAVHR